MLLCIIVNMNQNYNKIPSFVKKIPKQQLKYVIYQNKKFLIERSCCMNMKFYGIE